MRTGPPHKPLRASKNYRRRDEERRDAHVVQTRDGPGSIIAVHRAEDLVASERCFNRNFRRLGVADFTDHDNVGVLPQNRA